MYNIKIVITQTDEHGQAISTTNVAIIGAWMAQEAEKMAKAADKAARQESQKD